jgi:hypothetical protein
MTLLVSLSLCYNAVIVNMNVSLIRNTGYANATEVLKFGEIDYRFLLFGVWSFKLPELQLDAGTII